MANTLERNIEIGTAVGIAILACDSFHKYLPSVSDIRAAKPGDTKIRADVHAGETLAGITIATVSFLASAVAGNGSPIVIGGIGFLAMVTTYEWLLRTPDALDENG